MRIVSTGLLAPIHDRLDHNQVLSGINSAGESGYPCLSSVKMAKDSVGSPSWIMRICIPVLVFLWMLKFLICLEYNSVSMNVTAFRILRPIYQMVLNSRNQQRRDRVVI